jgi:hypothetical protein
MSLHASKHIAVPGALTVAATVLAFVIVASPADATEPVHRSVPRHATRCHQGYKKVRYDAKVRCVKRQKAKKTVPPVTVAAPASPSSSPVPAPGATTTRVELHAHLDPSYTQNTTDPFDITYRYLASATQQIFSAESVAVGGEEPAPLPSGVLTLYSDGRPECSILVGGPVDAGECTVEYAYDLGEHTITTTFTSGGRSATEVVKEDLLPMATRPIVTLSYVPYAEAREYETGVWEIGTLMVGLSVSPSGADVNLGCSTAGDSHEITEDGCYEFNIPGQLQIVFATATGECSAPQIGDLYIAQAIWPEPQFRGQPIPAAAVEAGTYHLAAYVWAFGGYAESRTTTPFRFDPGVTLPPTC